MREFDLDGFWENHSHSVIPAYVREIHSGKIIRLNKALEELTGYSREELPDMETWFSTIYPDPYIRNKAISYVAEFISGNRVRYEQELPITTSSGEIRHVEFFVNRMVWNGEPLDYHLVIVIDVTGRVRAKDELAELNKELDAKIRERTRELEEYSQRLSMALGCAKEGIWEVDLVEGKMLFTHQLPEMLGYDQNELSGNPDGWDSLTHPEDWPRVKNALQEHFDGKTDHYEAEYRVRARDGSWVWVLGHGLVTKRGADGKPLKAIGTHVNIDKLKRTEFSLREREDELKLKTENLEQVNTALHVLLEQRNKDKAKLEEIVIFNMDKLVKPYLDRLETTLTTKEQRNYLSLVKTNIDEVTSPFTRSLSTKYMHFTPREIQVADLVRNDQSNKEIAEILVVSESAVEYHRHNIRKKLGIVDKKINLRTFLKSLE